MADTPQSFGRIGPLELKETISSDDIWRALRQARKDGDVSTISALEAAQGDVDRALKKVGHLAVLGWWLIHDNALIETLQNLLLTTDRFHEGHWIHDMTEDDDWNEIAVRLEREREIARIMIGPHRYWTV